MAIGKDSSSGSSSKTWDRQHRQTHTSNENLSSRILGMLPVIADVLLLFLKLWWIIVKAIIELISPVPLKSVKGEIVLVTGAASGIGKDVALKYASEGAVVVCWDINEKGILETVDEIERLGYPKAYAYVCNVTNRKEVIEVAEKVRKEVGDVTILINNAGALCVRPILDHTAEDIQRIMNVNVMGHFWTLQAFLPAMIKNNHGHIVAVASLAGLMAITRNVTAYSASKFAVRGLMESLYHDLHVDPKCQIKTTCINPSAVHTRLLDLERVHVKYPKAIPIMTSQYAAECIMNAQRRDMLEVTIPRHLLTVSYCLRLLPPRAIIAISEFLDCYIKSD